MARPVKFDREAALQTAMHAIWTNGFERSSVKALSDLLGITRSSFYNSFGSRDALFLESIPAYQAQNPYGPLYRQPSAPVLPLVESVFREICRARAADPEGRGCMIVNTICELAPGSDGLGEALVELVLGSVQRLEQLMEMARADGELVASSDPHALALALQNLMLGLNVLSKVIRDEAELWLTARTTLAALGICRPVADA